MKLELTGLSHLHISVPLVGAELLPGGVKGSQEEADGQQATNGMHNKQILSTPQNQLCESFVLLTWCRRP